MSRDFSKEIFRITCNEKFSKDYRFKDQIRASSGSIMDNIAEGFERSGNKELCEKSIEISKAIAAFIEYLKQSEIKGIKYKKV
jgi:four helix bundle protein